MTPKNEISQRFIEAYETLLNRNIISDKRNFASKLGISASMVTEISKGRSSVGVTAIQNIVSVFNISAHWLLTGNGEILQKPQSTAAEPAPTYKNEHEITDNASLIAIIQEQAEEIGRLKECIRQLTTEKERGVSSADLDRTANAG